MRRAPTPVPTPAEGERYLGSAFAAKTDSKFKQHDFLIYAVLIVVGVAMVTMVIATFNMYVDQSHANYEIYKENTSISQNQYNNLQTQIKDIQSQIKSLHGN
jgi:uncharacterized protein YlxW (UPF0749 family)